MKRYYLIILFLYAVSAAGQELSSQQVEHLEEIYNQAWDNIGTNPDSAIVLSKKLHAEATSLKSLKYQAYAYSCMAEVYAHIDNFQQAIQHYRKALEIYKKTNNFQGLSVTYGNIGNMYFKLEEFEVAKRFYLDALEIEEKHKDTIGMIYTLVNIGVLEKNLLNYDTALERYLYCLDLLEKRNSKEDNLYANTLGNIASLYLSLGNGEKGLEFLIKTEKMSRDHNIIAGLLNAYNNFGNYYEVFEKDYPKAIQYFLKALDIAEKWNSADDRLKIHKNLVKVYKSNNDYKNSLRHLEELLALKAERENDENTKALARLEIEHEFQLKATADSLRMQKEKEVVESQMEVIQQRQYFLFGGGILGLLFTILLLNRYRTIRQKNKIISFQKQEVEQKNQEVMDSITYAQRIQKAYMPLEETLQKIYSDSFILSLPKDFVSGDFHWFYTKRHGEHPKEITRFLAVADCTGHGVPGALMSVICCNALNEVVVNRGVEDPGEILNQTREIVKMNLKTDQDASNKDGMDISLLVTQYYEEDQTNEESSTYRAMWAGANNSLWVIANNKEERFEGKKNIENLFEFKPNKQPIGLYSDEKPFTSHSFKLYKGDIFYLFSDGYQDQFGGITKEERNNGGKKFKSAKLKKNLLELKNKPMSEQLKVLNLDFENWRGELEQVDDVCLIGVRL